MLSPACRCHRITATSACGRPARWTRARTMRPNAPVPYRRAPPHGRHGPSPPVRMLPVFDTVIARLIEYDEVELLREVLTL